MDFNTQNVKIETSNNNNNKNKNKNVPHGLSGIVNTGNTCYMNSAIQALSHNYLLTNYLFRERDNILDTLKKNARIIFKDDPKFEIDAVNGISVSLKQKIHNPNYHPNMLTENEIIIICNHTFTSQLIKLLENMWMKNCIVIPTSFKKVFSEARNKFFFGDEQHDAEEAYSCIIQKIQEELVTEKNIKFKVSESVQDFINFKNNIVYKLNNCTNEEEIQKIKKNFVQVNKEHPIEILTIEACREMKKYYSGIYNPATQKYNGGTYSQITELFSGFLHSSTRCPNKSCGYVSNKFDPFLLLQLSLETSETHNSIYELMKEFSTEKQLDEHNLWNCDSCNNKVCAIKCLKLWKAPPVLVIQLKRFKQHISGRFIKDNSLIKYPENNFDISSIISPSQLQHTKTCYTYRLHCVINHEGGRDGGHYYTYCIDEDSEVWYEYNDKIVTKISRQKIISRFAYLLFYIREDLKFRS